jgi:hypothetical protein
MYYEIMNRMYWWHVGSFVIQLKGKKKVNFALEQALKPQRASRGIPLLFF